MQYFWVINSVLTCMIGNGEMETSSSVYSIESEGKIFNLAGPIDVPFSLSRRWIKTVYDKIKIEKIRMEK